ncbi:hypothetical protein V5739_13855 [Salinimicrobium sp. TIG7-5_MAKvit]|uniref:hypothetical protein n=1 Tax=Salinimicrobium sp. TIG7-5_MAKvit TaxID=3121289 RepID=UPI003C6DEBC8
MQQKLPFSLFLFIGGLFLFSSCSNDDDIVITPMEFADPDYQEDYELMIGETLTIEPDILNPPEDVSYLWILNEKT